LWGNYIAAFDVVEDRKPLTLHKGEKGQMNRRGMKKVENGA